MNADSSLDRLAEAHHIESGYTDVWRRHHPIGGETQRALLAAMGVPAGSAAEIHDSLQVVETRAFDRLLPDVVVHRQGEPMALPIAVDAAKRGRLSWSIATEEGDSFGGKALVQDLQMIDQTEIHGRHRSRVQRSLPLMTDLPLGYHRCIVTVDDATLGEAEVIIAPQRAYWPASLERGNGLVGVTAPLYGLRSARNAGVGDYSDLACLAETVAPSGAAFVGINPVHALFPSQPTRISPYAPSSRSFLNVMLIALDAVPELDHSPTAQLLLASPDGSTRLARLRAGDLVDYVDVAAFKLEVLEALFRTFCGLAPGSPRRLSFQAFYQTGGQALERHARFEALAEHLQGEDASKTEWREWPSAYRSPETQAVQAFAHRHADRVSFYAYLQWLARDQLEQAQSRAMTANMAIGLYLDLAVGVAADGAEAWSDQDVLVDAVRIGAPPDDFNPNGQNWGLLPLSPKAMQVRRYRPFIDLLRHTMGHAGAIRIDHVLGLAHSFWLPADRDLPGAYVRYPMQDLLGLVALESHRQCSVVIGEDLGTVPNAFRGALAEHGLLGCRLLYFERDEKGACRPASSYPKACVASIGTHDLPTLKGFWAGRDIDWRARLGLYDDAEQAPRERQTRRQVSMQLLRMLASEGLLPEGIDPEKPPRTLPWAVVEAFHRFLARTPAALKAVQLEDALGAMEQPNLPGTVDAYPNWRRKISVPVDELAGEGGLLALLGLFQEAPDALEIGLE